MDERISVKKVTVNFGVNAQGQIMGNTHVETNNKKLFVVSGRYVIIETLGADKVKTIVELPLGPFGFEYVPISVIN